MLACLPPVGRHLGGCWEFPGSFSSRPSRRGLFTQQPLRLFEQRMIGVALPPPGNDGQLVRRRIRGPSLDIQ